MSSIQKIMVPVDLSDNNFFGLEAANDLATRLQAKVEVVHFWNLQEENLALHPKEAVLDHRSMAYYQIQLKNLEQEVNQKIKAITRHVLDEDNTGEIYVVNPGMPNAAKSVIDKINPDLLIVGQNYSSNPLSDQLLKKLIRKDLPVLSVNSPQLQLNNILITTDLSTHIPDALYKFSSILHDELGAQIHLANVITTDMITDSEVTEKLHMLAKHVGLINYQIHVAHHIDEVDGILSLMNTIGADLVLMKTYEKSGLIPYFFKSLAEKVINKANSPVLVEQVKSK